MSRLAIDLAEKPFSRWMGPYSPARGMRHGLRFNQGRPGVWSGTLTQMAFWTVEQESAVHGLTRLVMQAWGGGRLLFLPNGFIVKPLPGGDDERGKRVLVGRFTGHLILEDPSGRKFNFGDPPDDTAGASWDGPSTLGLECVMEEDGSVRCDWYHPDDYGRISDSLILAKSSSARSRAFRVARPGESSGRVHLTPNGHVTTNYQRRPQVWETRYVCYIDPTTLGDWSRWISR